MSLNLSHHLLIVFFNSQNPKSIEFITRLSLVQNNLPERNIQKVFSLEIFSFWPTAPCFYLFILQVPPSTYCHFSELFPPTQKSSVTVMNFGMKNSGLKREKIINFFVNQTYRINIFEIVIYTMTIFKNIFKFIKKG